MHFLILTINWVWEVGLYQLSSPKRLYVTKLGTAFFPLEPNEPDTCMNYVSSCVNEKISVLHVMCVVCQSLPVSAKSGTLYSTFEYLKVSNI